MNIEDLQARCPPGWTVEQGQGNTEDFGPFYWFEHRGTKYRITTPYDGSGERPVEDVRYHVRRAFNGGENVASGLTLAEAVDQTVEEMQRLTGAVSSRVADTTVEERDRGGYRAVVRREVVYEDQETFIAEQQAENWIERMKQRGGPR